jgi:hypothetical protein
MLYKLLNYKAFIKVKIMQKKLVVFLFFIIGLLGTKNIFAQADKTVGFKTYHVAIFAPLYLDSVFTNGNYNYGKGIPKFAVPALDFVQGVQAALDSMAYLNANIKATIYDSKSYTTPVDSLILNNQLDSTDLIIGAIKDDEFLQLASFAKEKNIPFISAIYPNDGGITENPFLVIVNSTLKAHCEAIYSYLLQSHGTDKLYIIRKPGSQEDRISEYFKKINAPDGRPLLNIQTIDIKNGDFSTIKNSLDSNRKTVIIGGSLSQDFAGKLAQTCASLNKKYNITLIGMPNWDGFSFMYKKNALKDFPVYYTSPYYNAKTDNNSKMLQALYKDNYNGSPSDMTYKGFEMVYNFCNLLIKHPTDFMSHLNDTPNKIFCDYNFKPVFLSSNYAVPEYFENKHLYFIKSLNGVFSKAW